MGYTKGQKKSGKKGTSGEKGTPSKGVGTDNDGTTSDQPRKRTRGNTPKNDDAGSGAKTKRAKQTENDDTGDDSSTPGAIVVEGNDPSLSNKHAKQTENDDTEDESTTPTATAAKKREYDRLIKNIYMARLIFLSPMMYLS